MKAFAVAASLALLALAAAWLVARERGDASAVSGGAGATPRADVGAPLVGPAAGDAARVAARVREPAIEVDAHVAAEPPAEIDLVVEVVDANGAPVAGRDVGLVDVGPWVPEVLARARTDAEGRARFAFADACGARVAMPAVALLGAFAAEHAVRLDRDAPPDGPVRLVLPPAASVDVELRGASGAVDVAVATLEAHALGAGQSTGAGACSECVRVDGRTARFAAVEAGRELAVWARERSTGEQRDRRATLAPGEQATIAFDFAGDRLLVRGRLAADDGLPADADWSWRLVDAGTGWAEAHWVHHPLEVAPDGAFCARIDTRRLAQRSHATWLALQRDGELPTIAALVSLQGRRAAGELDVGTLVLSDDDALVAGRVVDDDGRPWPGVVLSMTVRERGGSCAGAKLGVGAVTDERGRFRVPGRGDVVLEGVLHVAGGAAEAVAAFALGARDVEVVLERPPAGVAGHIVVDAELAHLDLGDHFVVRGRTDDGDVLPAPLIGADGRFLFPAGAAPARVEVLGTWHARVLAVAEGAALASAADGRPPYVEFDLRSRLRAVEIDVRDGDGAPLAASVGEVGSGLRQGPGVRRARHVLLLDARSHDVVVAAPGHRSRVLRGLDADAEVVLERGGHPIELRWRAMPELPAHARVIASFAPIGRPTASDARVGATEEATFDARGRARTTLGAPGDYRVFVSVSVLVDGRGALRRPVEPSAYACEITVRDDDESQPFELVCDADAVVELVAAAGGRR